MTVISGPTVITEPGFYRIGTDVFDTHVPVWLDIRVSNVIIDGNGHTIDGVDKDGTYGIRVRGTGPLSDITIQNLTVLDFAYGLGLFDTSHSRIVWVSASSNTFDGVLIVGGSDNVIECSVIHQDDDGINLTATSRTLVANNIVTENVRGSGIHLSQGCDEITLLGNLVGANDEGIEIEAASNSTIRANRVTSSRYFGLNLTTAENLTVVDNYFNNRVNIRTPIGPITGVWSLEAHAGTNVVGNNFIGGNYWGAPDGTGFSDTTPDWDGDGFVNRFYVLPGQIGIDHLPLSPSPALLTFATVPVPAASLASLSPTVAPEPAATPKPWAGWRKTYPIGDGLGL